jgi:hypothetical protein
VGRTVIATGAKFDFKQWNIDGMQLLQHNLAR